MNEGEAIAIVGRNGAGKTTLTRALTGLIPASGDLRFDDKSLRGLPTEKIARMGLSLVPERRQLMDTMTVEDNVALGAYRRHDDRRGVRESEAFVYRLFPILAERKGQQARSLSGGQQQMLAIARALMARPRLLILDEPLLGLAPQIIDDIVATIVELRRQGLGIVVVEQNAGAILPIVGRAYVLQNGRVVMEGAAAELLESERLRAAFMGADISTSGEDDAQGPVAVDGSGG